jgi:hypothetical protein
MFKIKATQEVEISEKDLIKISINYLENLGAFPASYDFRKDGKIVYSKMIHPSGSFWEDVVEESTQIQKDLFPAILTLKKRLLA